MATGNATLKVLPNLEAGLRRLLTAHRQLVTTIYSYPSPSPAWVRTTSRRRRSGSRRLRRLLRSGNPRLACWSYIK